MVVLNKKHFSFFTLLFVLSLYLFLSVNIRPIADDYCAAAGSISGVLAYMNSLTLTWSGDYTQILFNGLLVAFPLSQLPMYFLGLLTLFLFVLLLLSILYVFNKRFIVSNSKFSSFAVLSALVLSLWNIYWALPAALSRQNGYDQLLDAKESFSGVFGWPTVIVQYLTVPLFLILIGLLCAGNSKVGYLPLITIGLIIGTSGYTLALATLLSSLLLLFSRNTQFYLTKTLTFNSGIIAGAMLSYFSLGAQIRSELLAHSLQDPSAKFVMRWFIVSFLEIATSIFNVGIFFVVLIGFLVSRLICRFFSFKFEDIELVTLFKFLSTFLLVYYAVISVSEFFTYNAFWHLITFRSLLFFYFFFIGIYLGNRFRGIVRRLPNNLATIVTCFLLLSAFLAVYDTNASIVERRIAWHTGPAALPGIVDISPEGSWVDVCWDKISNQGKYPFRDWALN
jgi:hypothetical protein